MQRLTRNDRGATAILVALLLPVLLAIGAIAIDVGAMHADKQQLQTGADAAALAVAQDCAREGCGDATATAQSFAAQNKNDADANATFVNPATGLVSGPPSETDGIVTVRTDSIREHWFAPIIGINESPIAAQATAEWGYPTGGAAVLPFVLSWCELEAQAGIQVIRDDSNQVVELNFDNIEDESRTILFPKKSDTDCTGPSGLMLPGGFGWIKTDGVSCRSVTTEIDEVVPSDPGNNVPSDCTPQDFSNWIGQTVLVPIFDAVVDDKNYQIFGYAAFRIDGYFFSQQFTYPIGAAPCGPPETCITGTFDRFVDLSEHFEYGADGPALGAAVVSLTK